MQRLSISQVSLKRIDALSQDCVVGVALGCSFTVAVTDADAGAVFFFGFSLEGGLGHGSSTHEVLPRGGLNPWRKRGGGSSPWPPATATPSR
jgi:hypothetical protein